MFVKAYWCVRDVGTFFEERGARYMYVYSVVCRDKLSITYLDISYRMRHTFRVLLIIYKMFHRVQANLYLDPRNTLSRGIAYGAEHGAWEAGGFGGGFQ